MRPFVLIDDFTSNYLLGIDALDITHQEFVDRVNFLETASNDNFVDGFPALVEHTKQHFDNEQALMQESGFAALNEHVDEHRRVLGDLDRLARQVARGRLQMARAYIREGLPDWFRLHATTIDSALAAHLKRHACRVTDMGIA